MVDEKQVQEADAAVTWAVSAFVSEFESMWGKWENVAPAYVIESALLELCTELSVLAPEIKTVAGPETVKLRDALAPTGTSELTSAGAAPQPNRWVVPFRRRGSSSTAALRAAPFLGSPGVLTPRAQTFSLGHLPDEDARYGPDP